MSEPARLAFERVSIVRMPGFEEGGFTLDSLAPGVNVIHGPNGSGKSTAARAIAGLLWPRRAGSAGVPGALSAVARIGGERWEIDVDRDRVRRRREGEPTDEALPLPPADAADRYSLALHELLQTEVRGKDLAAAVAREAAGGYDVDAARRAAGAKPKPGWSRNLFDDHEAAVAAEREIEQDQRTTSRDTRHLAELEAHLAAAREAEARVAVLDAALAHARCRARLAAAETELAGFPEALERLTGAEASTLDDLRRRLAEAQDEHERLADEAAALRRRRDEARLPDAGLPEGLLDTLRERRERAARLEAEADSLERDLAGARRRRDDARRALGELPAGPYGPGDPTAGDGPHALAPPDWRAVLDLAERADGLAADRVALDGLDDWTGSGVPGGSGEEVDRRLAAAGAEARRLHDWLRAPAGGWRARHPALAAALVLAALAAWGGVEVSPWLWALAGVAAVIVAWCAWDVSREASDRRSLEREQLRQAGAEPFPFDPEPVRRRLADLETEIAGLRMERERLAQRAGLDGRRARYEREAAALAEERRATIERLGFAPEIVPGEPAALAAFVRTLGDWRAADAEAKRTEQALGACRDQLAVELAAIRGAIGELGEAGAAPGSDVRDAAGARGAIDALARRADLHRLAAERLATLEGEAGAVARASRALLRIEEEIGALFARLGLDRGDDAGLRRLLDRLDDYREARRCADEAATELRLALGSLPDGGDRDELLTRSQEDLQAERGEAAEVAARREELADRIGRLRGAAEHLRHQHALEDAQAAVLAAADALRADRERETRAVVAWELADWLRERTARTHRPAVLKRAAELFARITGGAFRLLDPVGDPPVFRAEDSRAGRVRDLDELSGGRRLQLLVAARMGFVEEQERGVRVPLVLDETLANSDDESAGALIEAIVEIAREGRQVFYFTAQADEVEKWRAALERAGEGAGGLEWREIDLAAVRRGEEAERAPRGAWRPAERAVPAPAGADRSAYGEVLDVPGIDPRRGAGEVHLWHLVEDPEALHGLLARGIERWGDLDTLLRDGGEALLEGLGGGPTRASIEARARCVTALLASWRIGRGRPVDRGVLAASGAVSERFLDEASDLAEALGGACDALLEALGAGRVPGFRSQKTEELAAWLAERGYRDERAVLTRAELREVALSATASEVAAGDLTVDAVEELLERIAGAEAN